MLGEIQRVATQILKLSLNESFSSSLRTVDDSEAQRQNKGLSREGEVEEIEA